MTERKQTRSVTPGRDNGPWSSHVQRWQLLGPPLRPGAEDIAATEALVSRWHGARAGTGVDALLLGVTPELAAMRWPAHTRLLATDRSLPMIRGLWSARGGHHAVCAEWAALPLADASRDVVVGDGSFNSLACAADYPGVVAELRRVVRSGALLVLRFFVRPEQPESLETVFEALWRGRIGNFHIFKWRLAMALHHSFEAGVRLADIWGAWHAAVPEPEQLAAHLGWPLPVVNTIDAYRGADARYNFPTLDEARGALADGFVETACVVPAYELGERYPTLAFRPA